MGNYNEELTKYIESAKPFAQPVLSRLREMIHEICPEIEEKISWSRPNYYYKGKGMIVTDGLKERVTFGFWFDGLIFDPMKISKEALDAHEGMGFMKSVDDIPSEKILREIIKVAMYNIDNNVKPVKVEKPKKELVIPNYFTKALEENKKAQRRWEDMSPSHKKEYINWIIEAKSDETRDRRITQTLEQLEEGKSKHWKYQK